jgi:histidyl-tRNA synthetase
VGATSRETLDTLAAGVGEESEGVSRLAEISRCLEELDLGESFVIDPSITRGLDYYTGVVFETFLSDLPEIGSVCSGGRYNDLASLYTRQSLPGVGASVGLDRLMAAMEELGLLTEGAGAPGVVIFFLDESLLPAYQRFAAAFRAAGVPVEVFPEKRKLTVQFAYAEKKGIRLALIRGSEEAARDTMTLKDVTTRESYDGLSLEAAIEKAKEILR